MVKKLILAVLLITIVAGMMLGGCTSAAPATTTAPTTSAAPKTSSAPATQVTTSTKIYVLPTMQSGTTSYLQAAGFADAIEKVTGIKCRVIPTASDMGKGMMIRGGEAQLSATGSPASTLLAMGSKYGGYDIPEWGPQPVRLLWRGPPMQFGWLTRADSGIMYPKDVRGKAVAHWTMNSVSYMYMESYLAFGGLTPKDVKLVPTDTFAAAVATVGDKKSDACCSTVGSAQSQEVFAMPAGGRWITFPKSDVEGWKRLQAIAPYFFPSVAKHPLPTVKEGETIEVPAYGAHIWTYASLSDQDAYNLTKALHVGYDIYKGVHAQLADHTIDTNFNMLDQEFIPFHPGSIKYFKEIGRWTSDMDQWQAKQIKVLADLRTAFETPKK